MEATPRLTVEIKRMLVGHYQDFLEIEEAAFAHPWKERRLLAALRRANCHGVIAQYGSTVAGYCLYEQYKHSIYLRRIAVYPLHWELGVGRQLIDHVVSKLHETKRCISLHVPAKNTDAMLFFGTVGFKVVGRNDGHYESGEDAYLMMRRV